MDAQGLQPSADAPLSCTCAVRAWVLTPCEVFSLADSWHLRLCGQTDLRGQQHLRPGGGMQAPSLVDATSNSQSAHSVGVSLGRPLGDSVGCCPLCGHSPSQSYFYTPLLIFLGSFPQIALWDSSFEGLLLEKEDTSHASCM